MIRDGTLVFSKHEVGRFPNSGEVEERIKLLREGKDLPPIEKQSGGVLRNLVGRLLG